MLYFSPIIWLWLSLRGVSADAPGNRRDTFAWPQKKPRTTFINRTDRLRWVCINQWSTYRPPAKENTCTIFIPVSQISKPVIKNVHANENNSWLFYFWLLKLNQNRTEGNYNENTVFFSLWFRYRHYCTISSTLNKLISGRLRVSMITLFDSISGE